MIEAPAGSSESAFCTVKSRPFHIAVKERVVMLLSNLAQEGELRNTGIREHNIELALLPLDLGEEAIKIAKVRHGSLYAGYISSRCNVLRNVSKSDSVKGSFT
jgi:hypothetical protein